jgi:peptide/nickel transport system substrate-binding protein
MHSIDTSMTVSYYGNTASAIYRSMSLTSWAYPKGCTPYYPYVGAPIPEDLDVVNPYYAEFVEDRGYSAGETMSEQDQKDFIIELVEGAGYIVGGDGVYVNGNNKLKFTFTIAGSETDHPAFNAFYKASEFLNTLNFEINVTTDANALSKLASGDLAVWAAAWSSTIDPDMYQVYHMDSTATSTLNWGYKQIIQNVGGKYNDEKALIEELSEIIEDARSTNIQEVRAKYYSDALDIVMQLAVELPTYQRDDLYAYNIKKIDESSLNSDLSPYTGLLSDIHTVKLLIK